MTRVDEPPLTAQVLFADCRAPGPISASIGWKVKDYVEAPGSAHVGEDLLRSVDAFGQAYVPDVDLAAADRSSEAVPVLKQVRMRRGVVMLAQFSDAGIDRTGRASHVMHGLIHTDPLRAPNGRYLRPIELFGSSMWLRPLGNDEVETASAASLGFDLPTGALELESVLGDAFLTDLDRPERIELLPVILEAFHRTLDGRSTLLLVVDAAMEAARWLALLSSLLDPVTAGRLLFSTREEFGSTAVIEGWDLQFAAVTVPTRSVVGGLRDQLTSLGDRFVVLDLSRPPRANPDGSWQLDNGTVLPRSAWTDIAETVLMSPVTAGIVRGCLDRLADDVTGVDADPEWALPVAALLAGIDLPDRDETVRLVFRHWPTGAHLGPDVVDALHTVLADAVVGSATLLRELSVDVDADVPDVLADAVIDGAVRQALADPVGAVPALRRKPSMTAIAGLARDLPGLVAWLGTLGAGARLAAMERIVRVADVVGIGEGVVHAALRPWTGDLVAAIVDPMFDPVAARWPTMSRQVWTGVVADLVSDALARPGVEVSAKTHTWLTPTLPDEDLPERAAALELPQLTTYALRRAAWQGAPAEDVWRQAYFAAGMTHVYIYRLREPIAASVTRALQHVLGARPMTPELAKILLGVLPVANVEAVVAVTDPVLRDSGFDADRIALAQIAAARLGGRLNPAAVGTAPIFVHQSHDALVTGPPATAATPWCRDLAKHVVDLTPRLSGRLRESTELMALSWALRLPVGEVWSPRRVADPRRGQLVATVARLRPDDVMLDAAATELLRRNTDDDAVLIVANLLVRVSLSCWDNPFSPDDEPLHAYLARAGEVDQPRFLRAVVAPWSTERPKAVGERLRAAVDDVIDDLGAAGWRVHGAMLREDRDTIFDLLQSRPGIMRLRSRR